ncbi:MAG: hypothetical protein ACE5JL_19445 [Dehalococcoidia bacterium]
MKELEVKGIPPSPEHQFWRQAVQEIRRDSVKTVEDAARQLIALVTLLSGLYFHAITFSQLPRGGLYLKLLFVGPLALWVLCLLAATLVFFPQRFMLSPYAPNQIESVVTETLAWKYRLLVVALGLLVVSLSWLVVAAWVYLDIYVAK